MRGVILLLALLVGMRMVHAVIYLSPEGGFSWNGSCGSTCTDPGAPCLLATPEAAVSSNCEVVFFEGSYGGANVTFSGPESAVLTITQAPAALSAGRPIEHLTLIFTTLKVQIESALWLNSSIVFEKLYDAKLSNLRMTNSPIFLVGWDNPDSKLSIVESELESDHTALISTTEESTQFSFPEMSITTTQMTCQSCNTLISMGIGGFLHLYINTSILTPHQSLLQAYGVYQLNITDSAIKQFNGTLYDVSSEITIFTAQRTYIAATDLLSSLSTVTPLSLSVEDSYFRTVQIGDLRSSNIEIWTNVTCTDAPVRFPSSLALLTDAYFVRTVESLPSEIPFFWLEDFQTQFSNVEFIDSFTPLTTRVLPNVADVPAFYLVNGTLLAGSNLEADTLTLGMKVDAFGTLQVKRALLGDWTLPITPLLRSGLFSTSSGLASTWSFGAMTVTTEIRLENVVLTYIATDVRGIWTPCEYRGGLAGIPDSLGVLWLPPAMSNPPALSSLNAYQVAFIHLPSGQMPPPVYYALGSVYIIGGFKNETIEGSGQGSRFSFYFSGPVAFPSYENSTAIAPILTVPCGCPLPSPGELFECVFGNWQYTGSLQTPIITLPSGVQVTIIGNLTVDSIQFNGIGTNVNVSGCANITKGITLILNPDEITPGTTQQLIQQNGVNCSLSLQNIVLEVLSQDSSNCKQVTVTTSSDSTPSSLTVLFGLDESSCSPKKKDNNTRWIILGSVLGGVLLITTVLLLVFTLNPAAKNCIRPYRNRKTIQKDLS